LSIWNHHIVRGSFRLAAVALGYISRLPPGEYYTAESLASEVTRILYSSAPQESQEAAYRGVLEVMTILVSEQSSVIGCPQLAKLAHEDGMAYALRMKKESEVLAKVVVPHLTIQ
jgi:hypothetical protein